MVTIAEELADAAASTTFAQLPEDVTARLRLFVVDTLACAVAAVDSPVVAQTSRVARRLGCDGSCSVVGEPDGASVQAAALVNSVAARYLDLNDTYLGLEPIHPSDTVATLLSAAEHLRCTGADLLTAVAVAYEALCRLCDSVSLRERGWDGVSFGSLATALGTARLLRLDPRRTAQALSIAVTDSPALLRTRAGELSSWKALAFPTAAGRGLLAAFLAAEGVTGPPEIFEGPHGLHAVATGPFELAGAAWRSRLVRLKVHPAQYFTHTAIEAALLLHGRGVRGERIDRLTVRTYGIAMDTAVRDPERWAPTTRETADHSLPYCLAVALLDGELTARQFSADRLAATDVRGLLARLTVTEDPSSTARYPDELPCQVTAVLTDGRTEQVAVDRPAGDPVRGVRLADVRTKVRGLVDGRLADADAESLVAAAAGLERLPSVDPLGRILSRTSPGPPARPGPADGAGGRGGSDRTGGVR